jgi:hypothetical protein
MIRDDDDETGPAILSIISNMTTQQKLTNANELFVNFVKTELKPILTDEQLKTLVNLHCESMNDSWYRGIEEGMEK